MKGRTMTHEPAAWHDDPNVAARVSFSQVNTYLDCSQRWAFRYGDGLIVPPGIALIRGSSVHVASESNYRNVIEVGELLPLDAVKSIARDDAVGRWKSGVRLVGDEKTVGVKKLRGKLVDDAVDLSTVHALEVAPMHDPVAVEESHIITNAATGNKVKVVLDVRELGKIRDIKTSGKSPSASMADKSMQLTLYAAAVLVLTGKMPEVVALDYLVKTSGGKVYAKTLESTRTLAHIKAAFRVVEGAITGMRAGIVYGNVSSNLCNARWCGYYDRCPFTV